MAAARHLVENAFAELDATQLAAVDQPRIDTELVGQVDHHRTHRRMTEHDRRPDLMWFKNELLPNPEHVLDVLLLELAQRLDAGVDKQKWRTKITRPEILQKFDVALRHLLDSVVERRLGHAIAVERLRPAIDQERFAVVARHTQKRQHHVLMVAFEENDFRLALLALD